MDAIEETLARWKASLVSSIPVAGLISRSPLVYKWKAPFRAWMLREAVFWRLQDLMAQSYALHHQQHGLGARILLRSGFETLATLIYLNQTMQQVLDEKISFHAFGGKTTVLLLGSRNDAGGPQAINIISVLEKCDKRYPGIMRLYADLSESAHPNYEGLCNGFSKINHTEYETIFSNRWMELYGDGHLNSMRLCMETFRYEYDEVWTDLMSKLEVWMELNDTMLEATKSSSGPSG